MTLWEAQTGEHIRVIGLVATGSGRRRFLDLGFVPGTMVEVVRKSPLGDPVAYRVRGATIALRGVDARQIMIER